MNTVLRGVLERYLSERSRSSSSVSRALGKSDEWLYRILRGERRITVENLEAVVLEIGVGLDEFFVDYLKAVNSPLLEAESGHSEDPAVLLRALRGDRDPSLGWIGELCQDRVTLLQPGISFPLHANVQRLDDAREFERQAALVEAEAWLRRLHKRSQQRRRLNAEETSQLCTALGVWSSIQRAIGRSMLSVKALELVWELHGEAPMAPSYGDLLERTAVTLHHFGYTALGCPLMQRSFAVAAFEDEQRKLRAHLGLAIFAFHSGYVIEAQQVFLQIRQHPEADDLRVASATSFLARIEEEGGRLEEATRYLDHLEPRLASLPLYMQLALLWRRSRLLKAAGALTPARRIYEQLVASSRFLIGPVDRAVLLLHLVEVLVELEDFEALESVVPKVASLLEDLEDTPLARKVMSLLLLTLRQGDELDTSSIRTMRSALENGGPCDDYPIGSMSGRTFGMSSSSADSGASS